MMGEDGVLGKSVRFVPSLKQHLRLGSGETGKKSRSSEEKRDVEIQGSGEKLEVSECLENMKAKRRSP